VSAGTDKIDYEVVRGWEQLPEGWSFVEVAGVATDSEDRVYAFSRGDHPVLVFDRDGHFLDAWGAGVFTNAHGICIGPDDTVYCADNMDHTLRIFRPDGTLVRTLGNAGVASDTGFVAWTNPVERAAGPFNMVTNAAPGPDGRLYVSDGYGNARVHVFDPDGQHLFSWGEPGTGPGQFRLPTASPWTATVGSTSRTARTRASRSSPRRASMWTNGATSTVPTMCTSTRRRTSTWPNWASVPAACPAR